jgi:hypothetical protein
VSIPLGTYTEQTTEGRKQNLLDLGALQISDPKPGRRPLQVLKGEMLPGNRHALQDGIAPWCHDLTPGAPVGMFRIDRIYPVCRRIEVGAQEEAPVSNLALERGWQVPRHGNQIAARGEVLKVEIGLIERSGNADDEPSPVG